ncbi:kinase-like domain-containing protein [Rhizophagus clarus]|uniref:non-specific serine/threonine protein kinase n=1 Tax=Rhizophagus clarus TaxID=94130 RepID=A0A8H3R1B9_9GLOM|nr:kinase-like domain-containing protein [Rhizophagus clarus]
MDLCEKCNRENTLYEWCKECNVKHFRQNFENWSSGNFEIDKFIQDTQLSTDAFYTILEWIPYDRFYNIKHISNGSFSKVYRANWIDGYIRDWDNKNQNWTRVESNKLVALKSLNNSNNVTMEIIHRNLHIGNILSFFNSTRINDMRLCKPACYNGSENTKNGIFGILPYVAPEILRGQNSTKSSDIYSFGIIMYEVISGLPPYHDQMKIENILRPWRYDFDDQLELKKQIKEADEINNNLSINNTTTIHSEAIYTSKLLNFNDLPEPKNSDDYYYNRSDNIISEEFLETLTN